MNPIFCVLFYIFPDLYKWKSTTFDLDIDLSLACLNLLHSVLNMSSTFIQSSNNNFAKISGSNDKQINNIDSLCEAILINTECSESLLNLINVAYEFSLNENCLKY